MPGLNSVHIEIVSDVAVVDPGRRVISAALYRYPAPLTGDRVDMPVTSVVNQKRILRLDLFGQVAKGSQDIVTCGLFVGEFHNAVRVEVVAFKQNAFNGFGIINSRIKPGPRYVGVDADGKQPEIAFRFLTRGGFGAHCKSALVVSGKGRLNNEQ